MEPTVFLVTIAIAWGVIGLITSYVMGRRGHNPFGWLFLGAVFGPLVVPLAIGAARRARMTILGTSSVAHLEENVAAAGLRLLEEEFRRLSMSPA